MLIGGAIPPPINPLLPGFIEDSLENGGREYLSNAGIAGNGANAFQTVSENHSLGQSVPTSFVGEQISDLADPNHSLFAEKTCVSHVDYGHYSAHEPLATPGHWSNADPWPTVDAEQHTFAPFVNSNPSGLAEGAFAAGTAFNDAITLPTAPNPYTWGPTVPQGPMDEFLGANFQYPDPSLNTMDPFTPDPNGDPYQGPFPANGHQAHFPVNQFATQHRAAVIPPKTLPTHAVDAGANAAPFDTAQSAPHAPLVPLAIALSNVGLISIAMLKSTRLAPTCSSARLGRVRIVAIGRIS